MKREILFRGKRVDNGEWVEGDLVINKPTKTYRIFSDFANVVHGEFNESGLHECSGYLNIVMPETVGQFTGLTDKNGNRIFEGDIVSAWSEGYSHKGVIRWRLDGQPAIIIYPAFANQGFWKLHGHGGVDDGVEVIGSIHDNPELL